MSAVNTCASWSTNRAPWALCLFNLQRIRPVHLACFSVMNMQKTGRFCQSVHNAGRYTGLFSTCNMIYWAWKRLQWLWVVFFFCFPSPLSMFERQVLIAAASSTDGYSYRSHDWRIEDTCYLIQSRLLRGHFFSFSRETLNEVSLHRSPAALR